MANSKVTSVTKVLLIRCLHELKIVSSLHLKFAIEFNSSWRKYHLGSVRREPFPYCDLPSKCYRVSNMDSIFVTLLVSHKLMSPLKVDLSLKSSSHISDVSEHSNLALLQNHSKRRNFRTIRILDLPLGMKQEKR